MAFPFQAILEMFRGTGTLRTKLVLRRYSCCKTNDLEVRETPGLAAIILPKPSPGEAARARAHSGILSEFPMSFFQYLRYLTSIFACLGFLALCLDFSNPSCDASTVDRSRHSNSRQAFANGIARNAKLRTTLTKYVALFRRIPLY